MDNIYKADEISKHPVLYGTEFCKETEIRLQRYNAAMLMAKWKDEQFKEQKKLTWKEAKYIIELDGDIETDNFMGSDEYYQAIADKANVVLFGLQGKLDD